MLSLRNPLPNMLSTWSSKRSSKSRASSTSSSASEGDSSRASDGQQTTERKRQYRASARSSYTVYPVSEREYDATKLDLIKSGCMPTAPMAARFSPSNAGDRRCETSPSRVRTWHMGEAEALALERRPVDHARPKCKTAMSLSALSEGHVEGAEDEPVASLQPKRIVAGGLSMVLEEEDEDEHAEEQRR